MSEDYEVYYGYDESSEDGLVFGGSSPTVDGIAPRPYGRGAMFELKDDWTEDEDGTVFYSSPMLWEPYAPWQDRVVAIWEADCRRTEQRLKEQIALADRIVSTTTGTRSPSNSTTAARPKPTGPAT